MLLLRVNSLRPARLCAALLVLSGCATARPGSEALHFPVINYTTLEGVRFAVYLQGEKDSRQCSESAANVARSIGSTCPACAVTHFCTTGPDDAHRRILSRGSLDTPSLRTADGKVTMTVEARDRSAAENACRQIERQSSSQLPQSGLRCYPSGSPR